MFTYNYYIVCIRESKETAPRKYKLEDARILKIFRNEQRAWRYRNRYLRNHFKIKKTPFTIFRHKIGKKIIEIGVFPGPYTANHVFPEIPEDLD